jgi:hypothetical protein
LGLLTPKGKKGDKKGGAAKNTGSQSKFIQKGSSKNSGGFTKKINLGGAQRGS